MDRTSGSSRHLVSQFNVAGAWRRCDTNVLLLISRLSQCCTCSRSKINPISAVKVRQCEAKCFIPKLLGIFSTKLTPDPRPLHVLMNGGSLAILQVMYMIHSICIGIATSSQISSSSQSQMSARQTH